MWQLSLLSRVVPAFGALIKEHVDTEDLWEQHGDLLRDAHDCYSDIVSIGHALYVSDGESASSLDSTVLENVLEALETRLPTSSSWTNRLAAFVNPEVTPKDQNPRTRFRRLNVLADSLDLHGMGGYHECREISSQPADKRQIYLNILTTHVGLFRKSERKDTKKRAKVLKRLREAATELLNVYCKEESGRDDDVPTLFKHPSHGLTDLAEKVYRALDYHWTCQCSHRVADGRKPKEARLSLLRHRQFVTADTEQSKQFEVLLPICKDEAVWKVVNFDVKKSRSHCTTSAVAKIVEKDICSILKDSEETVKVEFVIEEGRFWHLDPELRVEDNHKTMKSLHQLLDNGLGKPYILQCKPRERLMLLYVLANSMLYLYPSPWLKTNCNSEAVFFLPQSITVASPMLLSPYIAVDLDDRVAPSSPLGRLVVHRHPAVLALGILFLEIVTGKKFKRNQDATLWERLNKDNLEANLILETLAKPHRRNVPQPVSSTILDVIRACLDLKPPSYFPINKLSEDGPIRLYILTCIVRPLAYELQNGHMIDLSDLHRAMTPDKQGEDPRNDLHQDHDCVVEAERTKLAATWFDRHQSALTRLDSIRDAKTSNGQRVKIAILDSGICLSEQNMDLYTEAEPRIIYRDWVDQSHAWQDDSGHGTHLAILLRKIAPQAVVHVGRVYKSKPKWGSGEVIAQAIQEAIDVWQVDVIVLSLGFGQEHEGVEKSIRYAATKDVLIFAAASNDGVNNPDGIAWPARHSDVICVHSGTGLGVRSAFTPEAQDNMRVMVLGEGVKSAWPPHLKCENDHNIMNGTSCAAPIAAGIAALVLDYARGFLNPEEWLRLRRTSSMRKMFKSMTDQSSRSDYLWIRHWMLFDAKRKRGWIEGEIRAALR